MTKLSLLARVAAPALILAAGLGGVLVQPGLAAKKEEPKPGLKLSQEFVKVAQPAKAALDANTYDAAEPLVSQVEAIAKNDDEKYVAQTMRLQLVQGTINAKRAANPTAPLDDTPLAVPLDALIANPSTPASAKGSLIYNRGLISFNGKQWPQAVQYLSQARQAGYQDADIDVRIATAKFNAGDTAGASADLDAAITKAQASGKPAPEDYYKYAVSHSLKAREKPQTMAWLVKYAQAYPTPQTWHDVLVTYGLTGAQGVDTLDKNQRIDLFRLMRDTKGLADQSLYEEYAQDVIDRGLPTEALTILNEGKASGKLVASHALTELTAQANNSARIEGPLTPLEAKAKVSADGKLSAQTADAYLGKGDNAKAVELYRAALAKGGVNADEVNTHLGIALSRSGDKAGATTAFSAVTQGTRGNLAMLWSAWVSTKA